jgi:hypothetical protein
MLHSLQVGVRVASSFVEPNGGVKLLISSNRIYLISIGIVYKPCEEPACLMVKNKMASPLLCYALPI